MTYNISAEPVSMFRTSYSWAIRVWHWLTFVSFAATITVVLFASTMFTTRDNISMVQQQVQRKGGAVSADQARAVAHEYSDKLWMLHTYIGYGLCFLLLCRMAIEAACSKEKRLLAVISAALRLQSRTEAEKNDRRHFILVKYGYLVFYLLFLVMALTGLGLAYEDVPFLRSIHKPITKIHSFTQYLIYFYILVHIAGVVRADMTRNRGIVSGMINGNPAHV